MQVDQINTDFMDLVNIAFENARDEKTRFEIVQLERLFKEHLNAARA